MQVAKVIGCLVLVATVCLPAMADIERAVQINHSDGSFENCTGLTEEFKSQCIQYSCDPKTGEAVRRDFRNALLCWGAIEEIPGNMDEKFPACYTLYKCVNKTG